MTHRTALRIHHSSDRPGDSGAILCFLEPYGAVREQCLSLRILSKSPNGTIPKSQRLEQIQQDVWRSVTVRGLRPLIHDVQNVPVFRECGRFTRRSMTGPALGAEETRGICDLLRQNRALPHFV